MSAPESKLNPEQKALAERLCLLEPVTDSIAEALLLLDRDEFERLPIDQRKAVIKELDERDFDRFDVLECPHCHNMLMREFLPLDGLCRHCGGDMHSKYGDFHDSPEWLEADPPLSLGLSQKQRRSSGSRPSKRWTIVKKRKSFIRMKVFKDDDWNDREEQRAQEANKRRDTQKRLAWEREEAERKARLKAKRERQARLKALRPTLGCLVGDQAGHLVELPDLSSRHQSNSAGLWVDGQDPPQAIAFANAEQSLSINGEELAAGASMEVPNGSKLSWRGQLYILDEASEINTRSASTIHLARNDERPGGPWPYWNDSLDIGAQLGCDVQVVDDGVDDLHARMVTRFGVVVIEDCSGSEDGLWVDGQRVPGLILKPGQRFRLGQNGPELIARDGDVKAPVGDEAQRMKPCRYPRTLLEVRDQDQQLIHKVFLFTRREVRFGAAPKDPNARIRNEWILTPSSSEAVTISEQQGALTLGRGGVDLRYDGGCAMTIDGQAMEPGRPQGLSRRFELVFGDSMSFEGRVYRSPTTIRLGQGPAHLGMKGGHPYECLRLKRVGVPQTVVFLVRLLRIGSGLNTPLRLDQAGVDDAHCQIMLSDGHYVLIAPRAESPVFVNDQELPAGQRRILEINTDIRIGSARLHFREAQEPDFHP